MTARQEAPPVAEWLRGRAQAHRRAAATCTRDGRPQDAEVYRRVAAELGDLAQEFDAYMAGWAEAAAR